MKRWFVIIAASFVIGVVSLMLVRSPNEAAAQADSGWATLFDGKSLDNWNQIGNANWRLQDGAVVADNGKGYLVSKNSYTDFQIRAEFWVSDDANSGIFFRCTNPDDVSSKTGYEANIFDQRPQPEYGTGAITEVAKVVPMPKAGGKWNVYEITAKGPKFTVILNGQKTVDGAEDGKFTSGRIALQHYPGVVDDKGVVKFRKVEIKPL